VSAVKTFDVIVIGAGSVGTPAAFHLARAGLSAAVFDGAASPGRGENRAAIGGVRATHSDRAKIAVCQESIDIFSTWREETGDDLLWRRGGYTFVAYTDEITRLLKDLLIKQQEFGLNIDWVSPKAMRDLVPGIESEGLSGGTFSPDDGSASPLMSAHSFRVQAQAAGATFFFGEPVTGFVIEKGRATGVTTTKGTYAAGTVIIASGADAAEVGALAGLDLPVVPDSHEAGITEPVERFFEPMVVDIRPDEGSKNFYFYQNSEGQLVFCITPEPPIVGKDRRSTSVFLPQIARRMVALLPRLAALKVRRVWRGLYPMTPDGFPIVGPVESTPGLFLAVGMCGQGFMLGPGLGALIAREITGAATETDRMVLTDLRPDREFVGMEALK
jgi:glycine/D-amino acid oxidase-like deaminating enzyme